MENTILIPASPDKVTLMHPIDILLKSYIAVCENQDPCAYLKLKKRYYYYIVFIEKEMT